jgi:hypothetical protein
MQAAPPSVAHGAVTFAIALPLQPVASWSGLMALAPLAFVFLRRAPPAYPGFIELIKAFLYRASAGA